MIENVRKVAKLMEDIVRERRDIERQLACKFCGAGNVVRYGSNRGIQRYLCNSCGRTFTDNAAVATMHTPSMQVASALSMYYGGMSLNAIRRHLEQQYGNRPSDSTVYRWLVRFTKKAIEEVRKHKPEVGDVWVADETVLRIGGKNTWLWDILDAKTRFLLASHISQTRGTRDAQILMEKAAERAGKVPQIVLTDKLKAYLDGIELAFGSDAKHIQSRGFKVHLNTNLIERFQGTLKDRTKVMRGLKSLKTARLLLDGWLVHYNFFRPHEALKDRTPAEKAGIGLPYRDWLDVIREGGYPTHRGRNSSASLGIANIGYHRNPAKHSSHKAHGRKHKMQSRITAPAIGVVRSKLYKYAV